MTIGYIQCFHEGDLCDYVYVEMPEGIRRHGKLRECKLLKSLYGLKQASRQWIVKLTYALIGVGFTQSSHGYSLFIQNRSKDTVIVLVFRVTYPICE